MQISWILVIALLGVVNAATPTFDPVSFCQRNAGAATNSAESALITAVLTRALFGNSTVTPAVTGILNDQLQMPFFNGSCQCTPSKNNFYTNTAARMTLFNALVNFFEVAMGCRDVTTTTPANMGTVHGAMGINNAVWTQFVGEVVNTLKSFGVVSTGATGDLTYAAALLGQFGKNAPQAICTQSDCPQWTDFAEFTSGSDSTSNFAWLTGDGTGSQSVTITKGGNVHINIGTPHFVTQTDSNFSPNSGTDIPKTTQATDRSLTVNFPNAGTYYFICPNHPTSMKATIHVMAASNSSSSTGGNGGSSSSTGKSASFAVSASFVIVLATIITAFAANSFGN